MHILIVDDDPLVRRLFQSGWPGSGDQLRFAGSFKQASNLIASGEVANFDGVIIDMTLPDGDGLMLVRQMRAVCDTPIIMISGAGTSDTRSTLIEEGADDYLLKPFTMRELHARLNRQHSVRHPVQQPLASGKFAIGAVCGDADMRQLRYQDATEALTGAEARLALQLYRRINMPCPKDLLYRSAFFKSFNPDDKTLDVYVSRLRKKVHTLDPVSADRIKTVRGVGYSLIDGKGS